LAFRERPYNESIDGEQGQIAGDLMKIAIGLIGLLLAGWSAQSEPTVTPVRVGDWVSMKVTGKQGAILLKQTLLAQDDKTATIKVERIAAGKVQRSDEVKILLTQLRDPAKLALRLEKSKVENTRSGKETLEINGKKYACDWSEFKVSYEADGKHVEINSKIWVAPEIPLNGMVKMEDTKDGIKTNSMELAEFGRGK
jgi:hypothetical protein